MKFAYIILAIVVVGGIAVLLTNQPGSDSATMMDSDTMDENMNENMVERTEVVEEAMPVPGTDAVDEMMVTDDTDTMMDDEMDDMTDDTPAATPPPAAQPESHVFNIGGTNFAFDVTEIRVKEGDTVTINFESIEGFHDWVVDEFAAATEQVRPGDQTSVTFVADTAGTYEYYCSVGSHRANGMVGTLIVE